MGKQWKWWQTLFSWAPKSLQPEIKRCLLLGRKAMTNLDSILKSRDVTLLTKVHLVKAMVFPVVIYGCESWTIKKAEHQRTDVFELWYWRRLLRVPWTARRSNQSVLKEINLNILWKDWCWSWSSFCHLMQKADLLGKTLMLGKIEGRRRRGWQRMRWLDGITDSMNMSFSKLWEIEKDRQALCAVAHEVEKGWSDWVAEQLCWCTLLPENSPAVFTAQNQSFLAQNSCSPSLGSLPYCTLNCGICGYACISYPDQASSSLTASRLCLQATQVLQVRDTVNPSTVNKWRRRGNPTGLVLLGPQELNWCPSPFPQTCHSYPKPPHPRPSGTDRVTCLVTPKFKDTATPMHRRKWAGQSWVY